MKELDYTVFPSTLKTIEVEDDAIYGGAHKYKAQNSVGFSQGEAQYTTSYQTIQFVEKLDDGTMTPGLQSEQLALILYDRCLKLNERFPSPYNLKMLAGLEIFLVACKERVEERMSRGVMGELKK